MQTDTDTKRVKPQKPAKTRFAETLQSVLDDYDTLPEADRFAIDKKITQHLDLMPKDWRMSMVELITALKR